MVVVRAEVRLHLHGILVLLVTRLQGQTDIVRCWPAGIKHNTEGRAAQAGAMRITEIACQMLDVIADIPAKCSMRWSS